MNFGGVKQLYKTPSRYIYIVGIVILSVFVVVLVSRNKKTNLPVADTPFTSQIERQQAEKNDIPVNSTEKFIEKNPDLFTTYESPTPPTYEEARVAKALLMPSLPINVDFIASNGMRLTLVMFTFPKDPDYLVRMELAGINYNQASSDVTKNPNAKAFVEAFEFMKKRIEGMGIDPYSLYYVFGTREYVAQTANTWVREFNLL